MFLVINARPVCGGFQSLMYCILKTLSTSSNAVGLMKDSLKSMQQNNGCSLFLNSTHPSYAIYNVSKPLTVQWEVQVCFASGN